MEPKEIYELFKKIDEKVDKISVEQAKVEVSLDNMKENMGAIKADIAYHIKRTDLLEAEVTKIRGFFFYFSVAIGFLGAAVTIIANLKAFFH